MEAHAKKPLKKLAKKRKKFGKKKNVENQPSNEEDDAQREDEEKVKLVESLMRKCDLTEKEVSPLKSWKLPLEVLRCYDEFYVDYPNGEISKEVFLAGKKEVHNHEI